MSTKTGGESKQKTGLDDSLNHIIISILDHGCRTGPALTIPDRIWVISRCDDIVGWAGSAFGRKEHVLNYWIPYVSNNADFTLTEKFTKLISDAEVKVHPKARTESLTWGKYFCVNCPNSSIYDIVLQRSVSPVSNAGLYAPFDLDLNSAEFDNGNAYYMNNPMPFQKFLLKELGNGLFAKTVIENLLWNGIDSLEKLNKFENKKKLVKIITEASSNDPFLLKKAEINFSNLILARTRNVENTVYLGQPLTTTHINLGKKPSQYNYRLSWIIKTIKQSKLYASGKNFVIFLPTPCTLFCGGEDPITGQSVVNLRSSTGVGRETAEINKKRITAITKIRELVQKDPKDTERIKKMGQEITSLDMEIEKIRTASIHKCANDIQTQCHNLGRPRLDSWLKYGIDKCKRVDDSLNKAESATCALLFKFFKMCVGSRVAIASPEYTMETLLLQINAPPIFLPRLEKIGITNLNKLLNMDLANTQLWKKLLSISHKRSLVLKSLNDIIASMKIYLDGLDGVSRADFKLIEKFNPMIITATILGFEGRFIKLGLPFFRGQSFVAAGIPQFHPWNPRGIDDTISTHEYAYDEDYYIDNSGKIKIKKLAILSPIQKAWRVMPTGHRGILLITYEAFVEAMAEAEFLRNTEILMNQLKQSKSTKEAGEEIKIAEVELLPLPPEGSPGLSIAQPFTKYLGGVTLKEKSITNKSFDNLQKRFEILDSDYEFSPGELVEILLLPATKQKWVKAKLIKNIGDSQQGEQLWIAKYNKNGNDISLRVRESRIRSPTAETSEKHREKVGNMSGGRKKKRTHKKKKKRRRKRKTRKKRRKTKKKRR